MYNNNIFTRMCYVGNFMGAVVVVIIC